MAVLSSRSIVNSATYAILLDFSWYKFDLTQLFYCFFCLARTSWSRNSIVDYYRESKSFSIGTQAKNLSLGITLIQVLRTDTDKGGDIDTTAAVVEEVTA